MSTSRIPAARAALAAGAVVGLVAALSACGSSSNSTGGGGGSSAIPTSIAMTQSQACKEGAQEGTFNYWTSTDVDVFKKEVAPFEKANPGIKVNYTSLEPVDQVQRIVTEVQAHHTLDVDGIAGDLPSFNVLFQQKLIMPVNWTKLGVDKGVQFSQDGVTVARTYRTVLGLGYNTKLVQPSELPSTWQGLVDSKWNGKVVVDPRGTYLSGLALGMGDTQAETWFTNFMKTDNPQILQGATASMEKIISGEAQLTTSSHDDEVAEQQANGAPVAIKYLDIVPTQDWYAMILKGAQHPAAAACFYQWWLSPQGQAQQKKYEFRSDVSRPASVPANAKLVSIDTPAQAQESTNVAAKFADQMTNG